MFFISFFIPFLNCTTSTPSQSCDTHPLKNYITARFTSACRLIWWGGGVRSKQTIVRWKIQHFSSKYRLINRASLLTRLFQRTIAEYSDLHRESTASRTFTSNTTSLPHQEDRHHISELWQWRARPPTYSGLCQWRSCRGVFQTLRETRKMDSQRMEDRSYFPNSDQGQEYCLYFRTLSVSSGR